MKILGLTGSIGMGKSTAARALKRLGVPVFDADATVHRLQGPGGRAVPAVEAAFPGTTSPEGGVNREALRCAVLLHPAAMTRLERIIHPLVRDEERAFLGRARRQGRRLVALDIPLLFETHGEGRCDAVAVVSAPAPVQRARVLGRPGMSPARLDAILARQTPDAEKRRRADYIIRTGLSRAHSRRAIRRMVEELR